MLLDQRRRSLFIFAGQRHESYMSDLWQFDLESDTPRLISADYSATGGPDGGFTQRSTIDEHGDWLMISGLQKDTRQQQTSVRNTIWIRRANTGAWLRVSTVDDAATASSAPRGVTHSPRPRFAHQVRALASWLSSQMVYCSETGEHYLCALYDCV